MRVVRGGVLAVVGAMAVALVGPVAQPASGATNGPTMYEADCTTALAPTLAAPFVITLDVDAQPDGSEPTGASFGATGSASVTIIGPVIAGIMQQLPSPTLGAGVNVTIGSTDGTATGEFVWTATFAPVPALGRQIMGVSWESGATTLTAAAGTFQASDVGQFVAGSGIDPQTTITAVAADGSSATIDIATSAAAGPVAIGTGANMTFTDDAFATGDVFTTNGTAGGEANIGVVGVTSVTVQGLIPITFGGSQGVGAAHCLVTGFDASGNPGPAQQNATGPVLPEGTVTPLVLASGGFITQPGTTQAITPAAAAFVTLAGEVTTTTEPPTTTTEPPTTTTTEPPTTTTEPPTTTTTEPPTTTTTEPPTTTTTTPPPPAQFPTKIDDCLFGGFREFGFKNVVHCVLFVIFLPDPPPAEIPTQPQDCFGDAWREMGFGNRLQCLILVALVPHDNGPGNGHGNGNGHGHGKNVSDHHDNGHGKGHGRKDLGRHRLISSVQPETGGGTAMLALIAGAGLFVLGAALPVRRRRS